MNRGYATVEFMISWGLFIGLVFFVMVEAGGQILHEYMSYGSDISISRSYRLFYTLFFTPGKPSSWNDALSAESIGLSDEYYVINRTKLENFMNSCNSHYVEMVNKVGRPFFVSVRVGNHTWNCPSENRFTSISRTMIMDGKPARVEVGSV